MYMLMLNSADADALELNTADADADALELNTADADALEPDTAGAADATKPNVVAVIVMRLSVCLPSLMMTWHCCTL